MSRFSTSRFSSARWANLSSWSSFTRKGQQKRRKIQRRKSRNHVVQTLERRDHPGSMLDVGMIALLGEPEGESKDPLVQSLKSAEHYRQQREQYERLTNTKPYQSPTYRKASPPEVSRDDSRRHRSDQLDHSQQRRAFRDQLLDLIRSAETRQASNPLLDSISQSNLSASLDQPDDSLAAGATSRSVVDGNLRPTPTGASGQGGGGGGTKLQPGAVDSNGTTMGSSPGASLGGGGGSIGDGATTQNATIPSTTTEVTSASQGDTASDRLGPDQPTNDSQNENASTTDSSDAGGEDAGHTDPSDQGEDPQPVTVTPQYTAEQLYALAGDSFAEDSPVEVSIDVATSTDQRGEGRFLVTGSLSTPLDEGDSIQLFASRGGVLRSLGDAVPDGQGNDANPFRVVGAGKINPGDRVFAHVAPSDGTIGIVSSRFEVSVLTDGDADGVSSDLEDLAIGGDGNADGIADQLQDDVTTIPDAETGKPATLQTGEGRLAQVRSVPPANDIAHHRLPLGLFEFEVHDIEAGSVQAVDVHLPQEEPVEGWFKEDPATGRLKEFFFDGTTGAVATDFGFTLYIEDGGRGDEDGLANGIIIDPGGPGYAGSITLGDGVADPLAPWTVAQYGGSDTGQGTVVADGAELVATEGDSLLTTITQTITIPEDPSWLIFGFEAFFDDRTDGTTHH